MLSAANILQDVERIRSETALEYAAKHHVHPRAFVFSHNTPPVRVDPDFSLPIDQSKAAWVKAIQQTVKRLNATAVLSVSESWLTKLTNSSSELPMRPRSLLSEPFKVVDVVLATLCQRDENDIVWVAPIERAGNETPLLKEWIESRPQNAAGLFFLSSTRVN